MKSIAVCHKRKDLYQDYGTVVDEKGSLFVRSDIGIYLARRAVSCLVEPETGDIVLFCTEDGDNAYILAVLERKEGAAATISVDGDLRLRLDAGRFAVDARNGIEFASARRIALTSAELNVKAATADLTIHNTSITGTFIQASLERIKLFAGSFDSLLDRIHQRVKRSYRFIEETDQMRAENIDHRAEKLLNLRGKNAVINARELVKLDGEQIHVG